MIDAFVNSLGLCSLGFENTIPKQTGCKPYDPAGLLKLFLYGYLNQITSTRKLENECHRNLAIIWLMARLAPDFKTIADFRKNNGSAIKKASAKRVLLCRHLQLISGDFVAIDGSQFEAAASQDLAIRQTSRKMTLNTLKSRTLTAAQPGSG